MVWFSKHSLPKIIPRLRASVRCNATAVLLSRHPFVHESPKHLISIINQFMFVDVKTEDFHTLYPDLYMPAPVDQHLARLQTRFNLRLIAKVSLQIGKKRLWVPMLLDTGSPTTLICQATLRQFKCDSFEDFEATVGGVPLFVSVIDLDTHFGDINVLGMDWLIRVFSRVDEFLEEELKQRLQFKAKDVPVIWIQQLVRDGDGWKAVGDAFQVKSAPMNIDDLKEAIKEKKPNRITCDADEMNICRLEDGKWVKCNVDASVRCDTTREDCYGYALL